MTASTLLDTPDRKPVDNKIQKTNELRLPLDKTEYLQPQSSTPATYLDLEVSNTNCSGTGNQQRNYATFSFLTSQKSHVFGSFGVTLLRFRVVSALNLGSALCCFLICDGGMWRYSGVTVRRGVRVFFQLIATWIGAFSMIQKNSIWDRHVLSNLITVSLIDGSCNDVAHDYSLPHPRLTTWRLWWSYRRSVDLIMLNANL